MFPRAAPNEHGYFNVNDDVTVNKPLPALSSPRSPNVADSEATQHLPSPTSPLPQQDLQGSTSHPPSQAPSSRLNERSNSQSPSPSHGSFGSGTEYGERDLIIRSYAPHIAVYASTDVEDLVTEKNVRGGLARLLRPFGEHVQGKVVIRNSHGISRAWDDFGIRIHNPEYPSEVVRAMSESDGRNGIDISDNEAMDWPSSSQTDWAKILSLDAHASSDHTSDASRSDGRSGGTSTYSRYVQRLLSNSAVVPYETFNHPVACLVAVSSRNDAPIETLRRLYSLTSQTNPGIPTWLGTDYLRYYVLVHDEDKDQISKSTALFDLMKRHFGLHCHLLRLRSSQCALTDDDSVRIPSIEWLSPEEAHVSSQAKETSANLEEDEKCVYESDVNAINSFIRELVTQSIIPFMENRTTAWNDQVASRKRGIGGRFMSMSKRWAGFGSSKSNNSTSSSSGNPSGSNYDVDLGVYRPETPEAVMRLLADHAMMLRDWKLAHNTYDLMRSDFSHDKAWAYHAAANEMAAVSSLLVSPQQLKVRLESTDQLLDTALYSYITRCSQPQKARRCLVLATELLRARDAVSAERAPKWAARLLELSILGQTEQCLVVERIAHFYKDLSDTVTPKKYSRHAAMWTLLASLAWTQSRFSAEAHRQLSPARQLYHSKGETRSSMPFASMLDLWQELETIFQDLPIDESDLIQQKEPHLEESTIGRTQIRVDAFSASARSHTRQPSHFSRNSEIILNRDAPDDGFE